MTDSPLLSIMVPVYNVAEYLDQCIQSILNQSYPNIELILINDGSTDGSDNICQHYSELDNRVIYIKKNKNEGLVEARKLGVKIARGKYIGFVDSDDYVTPNMFASLMEKAIQYDVDIVISGHKEVLNETIIDTMQNSFVDGLYEKDDIVRTIYSNMLYTGVFGEPGIFSYYWNKIFKTKLVTNNISDIDSNISMGEDAACVYPCIIDAKRIYILNETDYRYRQRVGSMIKVGKFDTETTNKYKLLYDHIKNKLYKTPKNKRDILIYQLRYFIVSLILVRLVGTDKLFGFANIPEGSRVSLVGAGTFGQNLYKKIAEIGTYTISGWYDEYADEYQKIGLDVQNINRIANDTDLVIIGYINSNNAKKVKLQLINDFGIPENKIYTLRTYTYRQLRDLLYEFNLEKHNDRTISV
jgi:glycosyltransferase involved in cell wall biosynthesis